METKCFHRRLNLDFKDARNMLEKLVTAKFEDKVLTYLSKTLGYTKKSQMQHLPDISIVEESFMVYFLILLQNI